MSESTFVGPDGPMLLPAHFDELLRSPAEALPVIGCTLDEARQRELDRLDRATVAVWRAEVQQLGAIVGLCTLHGSRCPDDYAPLLERFRPGGHDGTPNVSEYLCLEVAGVLAISPTAAAARIMRALDLVHRHPLLHAEVLLGKMRVWQANQITAATGAAGLSLAEANWVDAQLTPALSGLTFGRVMKLLEALIVQAAPALAAQRAAEFAEARRVRVCSDGPAGVASVEAVVDLGSAAVLNETVGLLAEQLRVGGDSDTLDVRRSKALGILGTPARALALLAASAGYADLVHLGIDLPVTGLRVTPKLLKALTPRTSLVVHCATEASAQSVAAHAVPESSTGVCARVDGVGPVLTSELGRLIGGGPVVVRPVVDYNSAPAVDRYEIPARTRQAVQNRTGHDAFPFGTQVAARCDFDHVEPYRQRSDRPTSGTPAPSVRQTRVENLTPLSRKAHRAKTDRRWRYVMTEDGYHFWLSPLGRHYLTGPHGTSRHDSGFETRVQLEVLRVKAARAIGPPPG